MRIETTIKMMAGALVLEVAACSSSGGSNNAGTGGSGAGSGGTSGGGSGGSSPDGGGDGSVAFALQPFTAPPQDPGAKTVLFTASGEALAYSGYAFPPAMDGDPAFGCRLPIDFDP